MSGALYTKWTSNNKNTNGGSGSQINEQEINGQFKQSLVKVALA